MEISQSMSKSSQPVDHEEGHVARGVYSESVLVVNSSERIDVKKMKEKKQKGLFYSPFIRLFTLR